MTHDQMGLGESVMGAQRYRRSSGQQCFNDIYNKSVCCWLGTERGRGGEVPPPRGQRYSGTFYGVKVAQHDQRASRSLEAMRPVDAAAS